MYCKHCGQEIRDDSVFCKGCGKRLTGKKKTNIPTLAKGFLIAILIVLAIALIGICINSKEPLYNALTWLWVIDLVLLSIFVFEFFRNIRAGRHKDGLKDLLSISFSPIYEIFTSSTLPKPCVVAGYILLILGIVHGSMLLFFENETIGSFYEKGSYEAEYQCVLKSWDYDEYVSCEGVATVRKDGPDYYIEEIKLGRDLTVEYDESYYPDDDENTIIANAWNDWTIALSDEPCSDGYIDSIDSYVCSSITSNICGSKNSDIYHNTRCGYVQNISKQNLIYFPNAAVADLMKYQPCERCGKWATTK